MARCLFRTLTNLFLLVSIFFPNGNCYTEHYFNGRYSLEWHIHQGNTITFTASAKTAGWVGFGINSQPSTFQASIVVGGVGDSGNPPTTGTPPTSTMPTLPSTVTSPTTTPTSTLTPSTTPSVTSTTPDLTSSTADASSDTEPPPTTTRVPDDPITFPTEPTTTTIAPITTTTTTSPDPGTFPTEINPPWISIGPGPTFEPGLQQNQQYNHKFFGDGSDGLGHEYEGGAWRFLSSVETIVNGSIVTSTRWERDLNPPFSNETAIVPYEYVYLILMYSEADDIRGTIRERLTTSINLFEPNSSPANLGSIVLIFATSFATIINKHLV